MKQWTVHFITGPVQPSEGFFSLKYMPMSRLVFCSEGLIAIPSKMRDALILGAAAGIGSSGLVGATAYSAVGSQLGSTKKSRTTEILNDDGNARWLRHPFAEIEKIVSFKSHFARHKIIVHDVRGTSVAYGLFIRDDFQNCEASLKTIYHDRVESEEGWF